MSADLRRALERVRDLAAARVQAARALDSHGLSALQDEHAEACFELELALRTPRFPNPADKAEAQALAREIAQLEARLTVIATTVVGSIEAVTRASNPTYGRRGQLAGR